MLTFQNLEEGNQLGPNSKVEWQCYLPVVKPWMCPLILKFRGFIKVSHDTCPSFLNNMLLISAGLAECVCSVAAIST